MKHLTNILIILSFLLVSTHSHGQILDKLGKKMEKKIEDRANRKIDKAMDKTLDKTEEEIDGSIKKKPQDEAVEGNDSKNNDADESMETQSDPAGILGSFTKQVDVEDSYDFDLNILYQMTSVSDKETLTIDYIFSLPKDNTDYMMMETVGMSENGKAQEMPSTGQMIFDSKNKVMVIIMEEQKMYMPMSMDFEEYLDEESEENISAPEDYSITKTGKTKSILGYSCEEYQMDSKDANGTIWVTNDSRLKNFDPFTAMSGMAKSKKKNADVLDIKGAVLEMHMTMKNAEKKSDPHTVEYKVKNITPKKFTKSLAGYSNPMSFQK